MTAREIYDSTVRPLPPQERLRLATLILEDIAGPSTGELDVSDGWSEDDVAELAMFAGKNLAPEAEQEPNA